MFRLKKSLAFVAVKCHSRRSEQIFPETNRWVPLRLRADDQIFFSVYLLNVKLHLRSVNYLSRSQQQIDRFSGSPPVSTLSA